MFKVRIECADRENAINVESKIRHSISQEIAILDSILISPPTYDNKIGKYYVIVSVGPYLETDTNYTISIPWQFVTTDIFVKNPYFKKGRKHG